MAAALVHVAQSGSRIDDGAMPLKDWPVDIYLRLKATLSWVLWAMKTRPAGRAFRWLELRLL